MLKRRDMDRMYMELTMKLLFILMVLIASINISQASYGCSPNCYVAASGGSDSNPGTIGSPWATLGYADALILAGDTLYIRGGTYTDQHMFVTHSGTAGNPITIRSYPGEWAIIAGTSTLPAQDQQGIVLDDMAYVNIQDLEIHTQYYGIRLRNWGSDAHHINIENVTVHNTGGDGGIRIQGGAHDIHILNSTIYDIGFNAIEIQADSGQEVYNIILQGNDISGNAHNGIDLNNYGIASGGSSAYYIHHVYIISNYIHDTGSNSPFFQHNDPPFDHFYIYDNVFENINSVRLSYLHDSIYVNNTIIGTVYNGMYVDSCCAIGNVTIQENDMSTATIGNRNVVFIEGSISSGEKVYWINNKNRYYPSGNPTYYLGGPGQNIIIDQQDETYKIDARSGSSITVNYSDGGTYSVDGTPRTTNYTTTSGIHTIYRAGGYPAYTEETTYSISGYALNSTSGLPSVTISNAVLGSTSSTSNGSYAFSSAENGTYNVSYSKSGYDTGYLTVVVSGANLTNQNKTLTATSTYFAPTPSCTSSNGSTWINVTCTAGAGNVTDAMNFTNVNTSVWNNGTATYWNNTGLTVGTEYTYHIYAYNNSEGLNLTYTTVINTTLTASTYIPPTPVSASYTNGSTWVNWTWSAGAGNVTNSYNVQVNSGSWNNGTALTYVNTTLTSSGYVNLTVYAVNTTNGNTTNSTPLAASVYLTIPVDELPTAYDDCRLKQGEPDTVLNTSSFMDFGYLAGAGVYRGVVLPNITLLNPSNNTNFSMYYYYTVNVIEPTVIEFYRPVSWNSNYVNWNNRTLGMAWNSSGGDWIDAEGTVNGNVPFATMIIPVNGTTGFYSTNITMLVRGYLNGTWTNTGFLIKSQNESNGYIAFYSWNYGLSGYQPYFSETNTTTLLAPVGLSNLYGNFFVNHTWSPDEDGAVTDSYNISINGSWVNGTTATFYNNSVGTHGWSNISVYAYNTSFGMNNTPISENVQVPNNAITISNISLSYSLNSSESLYIDAEYSDVDGDTGIFADNSTSWDINTSTGIVSWLVDVTNDFTWQITVSDGYGSTDTFDFTVDATLNATADDYDVYIDNVSIGAHVVGLSYRYNGNPGETKLISIRSHNHTYDTYSDWTNTTETTGTRVIVIWWN